MSPKQILEKLFTEPHADAAWFDDAFLHAVPIEKIDQIVGQLRSAAGKLKEIREGAKEHTFDVQLERSSVVATIILVDGKVQTLFIKPAESTATSLDEATAPFKSLPGQVAYTIVANGKSIAQQDETKPLAVGSAFKLAVLAELRDRIEKEKKLSWDRVVALDPSWKSLPSGVLQDWPDRTPITVQTLASFMISISDNTATDAMISLVGRASLAKYGASQFHPFLKTGDLFRLKAKGNEDMLARFRSSAPADREKMLDEIEKHPLPKAEDYPKGVTALDVEWFFSPAELCALMAKVHDLPLMSINPGVAKKTDWDRVSYKGGSEPGVLNMTTWVEKGPKSYCVSVTWNDTKPVEETRFAIAYGGALSFLAKALP
jgi:beta-lactamase class A